jgi:HTH-type transcriptional regulator/antitoxin HigA
MDIRPIRSEEDHAEALAEIERLWGAPVGSREGDKLDVLTTLVEAYEEKHWPIDAPDPVDVLRYAISELGHTQAELAELLGSRPRASEVLNRRRALTIDMVHKISSRWHIPADVLVRPYHLAGNRVREKASA